MAISGLAFGSTEGNDITLNLPCQKEDLIKGCVAVNCFKSCYVGTNHVLCDVIK